MFIATLIFWFRFLLVCFSVVVVFVSVRRCCCFVHSSPWGTVDAEIKILSSVNRGTLLRDYTHAVFVTINKSSFYFMPVHSKVILEEKILLVCRVCRSDLGIVLDLRTVLYAYWFVMLFIFREVIMCGSHYRTGIFPHAVDTVFAS